MAVVEGAAHLELTWPTVEALRRLGGSAGVEEISESVIEAEGISVRWGRPAREPDDETRVVTLRVAWACNYLKNLGAVEEGGRGVWSLTELGRAITIEEMSSIPPRPTCGA
jgi:restriction system protein